MDANCHPTCLTDRSNLKIKIRRGICFFFVSKVFPAEHISSDKVGLLHCEGYGETSYQLRPPPAGTNHQANITYTEGPDPSYSLSDSLYRAARHLPIDTT